MQRNGRFFRKSILLPAFLVLAALAGCKKEKPDNGTSLPFERLRKDLSIQSSLLNRAINYAVLLPPEYEHGQDTYPVVYLLHGLGDNEKAWYQGGNIRYYADQYAGETGPVIYVMPQGFNTYWVNKYSGTYPYMDMLIDELMPAVESEFRVSKEASQRAVMGYSMGGYGALILAAKNPEVFGTAVALSMSFRTDGQYLNEPQGVFDSQWGTVFGGMGKSGNDRLTPYFLEHSPFHFFTEAGDPSRSGQRYFIDCGDDEESLSETNNAMHLLMRDQGINHEYRVRNGAHSWDYWHKSLPEAFRYIGHAFRHLPYPDQGDDTFTDNPVQSARIHTHFTVETEQPFHVMEPEGYATESNAYPVIYILHDRSAGMEQEESMDLLARMDASISGLRLPKSLIVEIPTVNEMLSLETLSRIKEMVNLEYRVKTEGKFAVIAGNGGAGATLYTMLPELGSLFNACLFFDAELPSGASMTGIPLACYLDITDMGNSYQPYHSFYMSLRQQQIPHEYRVRQGLPSHGSFLAGLSEASVFIKDNLKK